MGKDTAEGYALTKEEGRGIWFLDTLMVVKASGHETGGKFTLIEQVMPAGFGPPPHIHDLEDEAFHVLEGDITFVCGDRTFSAGPGSFVFLPRGVEHVFAVEGAKPARVLQITSPSGFERFAEETGQPTSVLTLPPPNPVDVRRLVATARKYGINMLAAPGS